MMMVMMIVPAFFCIPKWNRDRCLPCLDSKRVSPTCSPCAHSHCLSTDFSFRGLQETVFIGLVVMLVRFFMTVSVLWRDVQVELISWLGDVALLMIVDPSVSHQRLSQCAVYGSREWWIITNDAVVGKWEAVSRCLCQETLRDIATRMSFSRLHVRNEKMAPAIWNFRAFNSPFLFPDFNFSDVC